MQFYNLLLFLFLFTINDKSSEQFSPPKNDNPGGGRAHYIGYTRMHCLFQDIVTVASSMFIMFFMNIIIGFKNSGPK